MLWVLLGFGVLKGHVSSVSGWWGGIGSLFLLSCAGIFCGFACGVVCLSEYDTPKIAIFSDLSYFFEKYSFN